MLGVVAAEHAVGGRNIMTGALIFSQLFTPQFPAVSSRVFAVYLTVDTTFTYRRTVFVIKSYHVFYTVHVTATTDMDLPHRWWKTTSFTANIGF